MLLTMPRMLTTKVHDGDGVDGADDGYGCGYPYDESGRRRFAAGLSAAISAALRFPAAIPRRLRSLRSLRAPLAGGSLALTPCRTVPAGHGMPDHRFAFSSRRRFAPRSSQTSPRSPWPAAPAAGIASGSARCTRAPPGAGFAAHRLAHHPAQYSPHSCGRSCGARPHFAPHRAVHWCPHDCGHRRLRLRQRAAHDCLRLPPHRPPLNRRGGSPPPASPASIPRTWMQQDWPFRTARGGLGSHTRRIVDARRARLPMSRLRCPRA